MNNHYHLLVETPDANLSIGMRQLNGTYTQYFNRANNSVGHLFQGRFKSILVEKQSYLLELCRYVVLQSGKSRFEQRTKRLEVEQLQRCRLWKERTGFSHTRLVITPIIQ